MKEERESKKYHCGYCGYDFIKFPRTSNKRSADGNKGIVSDQIKCPKCSNFLKTW